MRKLRYKEFEGITQECKATNINYFTNKIQMKVVGKQEERHIPLVEREGMYV